MHVSSREEIRGPAPTWFLHVLWPMCVVSSWRSLNTKFRGAAKNKDNNLYCSVFSETPGTNNLREAFHICQWTLYLATDSFWNEHDPQCKVTPIKTFCMNKYICLFQTFLGSYPCPNTLLCTALPLFTHSNIPPHYPTFLSLSSHSLYP